MLFDALAGNPSGEEYEEEKPRRRCFPEGKANKPKNEAPSSALLLQSSPTKHTLQNTGAQFFFGKGPQSLL
jgi:hypothetical protein